MGGMGAEMSATCPSVEIGRHVGCDVVFIDDDSDWHAPAVTVYIPTT